MKKIYLNDSSLVDNDGAFKCPTCGNMVNPNDETEDNYRILETKVEKEELKSIIIRCVKCDTKMEIVTPRANAHRGFNNHSCLTIYSCCNKGNG